MKIYTSINELQIALTRHRNKNKTIAFIPTMGALHAGHISLIGLGHKKADVTVCSIFVNPSQFNNPKDLEKYPRTIETDITKLRKAGCDIVFVPSSKEVYPPYFNPSLKLELLHLDKVMEGIYRPGHFKGMLEVVKRLLDIVQPQFLIMGQKDFQQFTLVQYMIHKLTIPTELIIGKIIREKNGLAMSSRNVRLSPTMRADAGIISKSLSYFKRNWGILSQPNMKKEIKSRLKSKNIELEYMEAVDPQTLKKASKMSPQVVVCLACWAEGVRLIDNFIVK